MSTGLIDMIATPKQGNKLPAGVTWCADNGCFGKGYPGDDAWFAWLESFTAEERSRCMFAVAPDVVGDAVATDERSAPWLAKIRALGYPVAYVAQDGIEDLEMPGDGGDWWDDFDVLFVGGSTEWKLGRHARALVAEAKRRGQVGPHGPRQLSDPHAVRRGDRLRLRRRHAHHPGPRQEPARGARLATPGEPPGRVRARAHHPEGRDRMTGMSDPLAGGFVRSARIDDSPCTTTPEQDHAAALTIVEHSTSVADARALLTMVGLR